MQPVVVVDQLQLIAGNAGAVVAEACAVGLPVVCLDRGGPPLLTGSSGTWVADAGGVSAIARRFADAASRSMERRRRDEVDRTDAQTLLLDRRAAALRELLADKLPGLFDEADPDDPRRPASPPEMP